MTVYREDVVGIAGHSCWKGVGKASYLLASKLTYDAESITFALLDINHSKVRSRLFNNECLYREK